MYFTCEGQNRNVVTDGPKNGARRQDGLLSGAGPGRAGPGNTYLSILLTVQVIVGIRHHQLFQAKSSLAVAGGGGGGTERTGHHEPECTLRFAVLDKQTQAVTQPATPTAVHTSNQIFPFVSVTTREALQNPNVS